jgi:hypothetical protein
VALDKLVHQFHIDPIVVIKKYLPLFDLEADEKILNTYLSLIPMEEEIKRYVLKEDVSRTNIRRISALAPKDRMALLSLISPLKLGENRLREILTFLEEIIKRDRLTIREILKTRDSGRPLSSGSYAFSEGRQDEKDSPGSSLSPDAQHGNKI